MLLAGLFGLGKELNDAVRIASLRVGEKIQVSLVSNPWKGKVVILSGCQSTNQELMTLSCNDDSLYYDQHIKYS